MAKTVRGLLFFGMAVLTVVGNISNNVTVPGMETAPDQLDIKNVATIPNVTEVSEHDVINMTQAEEKWHYERHFRKHCRILPDCTKPIIVEFNGKRYDITKHICLWQNENQNCPYLCVIAKGRECVGKPENMITCRQCYDNCNLTHPTFSEPFGNYWSICNSTEETTTAVPPTTTLSQQARHTEQPTVQSQNSTPAMTQTTNIDGVTAIDSRNEQHNYSYIVIKNSTNAFVECSNSTECSMIVVGLMIFAFIAGGATFLIVGARFATSIKQCCLRCCPWCFLSTSASSSINTEQSPLNPI